MYKETSPDGGQPAVSRSSLFLGVVFRLEFGGQHNIQVRRGLETRCEAFLDRLTMPRSKAQWQSVNLSSPRGGTHDMYSCMLQFVRACPIKEAEQDPP